MARGLPIKVKRVAAACDEAARLCERSGSEHSPSSESFADLSDLVTSFMERDERVKAEEDDGDNEKLSKEEKSNSLDNCLSDSEKSSVKVTLEEILARDYNGDGLRVKNGAEVELAFELIGRDRVTMLSRRLMSCLRERRFNAG